MSPTEAMNTIEGRRYAALTNLASNLKTFLRIAGQQPEVEALSRAVTNDPSVITEVLRRALALSAVGADGDRESEADAALATYLWLLSTHRFELAQTAARSVHEWRQFFWARKLAEDLQLTDGGADGDGKGAHANTAAVATDVEPSQRKS
jgi:hypothetical protein